MAFDFSPSTSLVAVQALLDQAHEIQGSGDLAASDADALNAYRRASGIAENAALSAENITIVLAQAEPSLAAYPAATRSLSSSATASVNEAGQTADRGIAQQAARAAIRAAESNRDLAKEAIGKSSPPSRVTLGTMGWVLVFGAIAGGVWWATSRTKSPMFNPIGNRCSGCGTTKRSTGSYCQTCKSAIHHALKRIEHEKLLVDTAGGSWWVWTPKGEVLVIGKPTKWDAIYALAVGDSEIDL